MPSLSLNDVVLVQVIGNVVGQTTINSYVYLVTSLTGTPTQLSAFTALHAVFNSGTGLFVKQRACCPINWTHQVSRYQVIRPTRYRFEQFSVNTAGQAESTALTANIQASITRVGAVANRRNIGGVRIPIGTDAWSLESGLIAADQRVPLVALATQMAASVTTTGTVATFTPCVGVPAPENTVQVMTSAFAQDTVRVLRRRTVRVGI